MTRTGNALTLCQDEYNAIIACISDAIIVIDSKGRIIESNAVSQIIFGYEPDTLIGRPIRSLIPGMAKNRAHDITDMLNGRAIEFEGQPETGRPVPLEVRAKPIIIDGHKRYLMIIKDISKLKQAETTLTSGMQSLRAMYDSSPLACMVLDLETLQITNCNKAAESMFMATRETLIGLSPPDFSPEFQEDGSPSAKRAIELIEEISPHGENHFFWLHKRMNGEIFPCEMNTCVRHINDHLVFIAHIRDMTDQRKSEQELRDAKLDAEKTNKLKSRFLANMSHEIRTPLNGIVGMSDVISNQLDDPRFKQHLSIIQSCSYDLQALIDDILTVSKIETDGIDLEPVPVEIRALMKTVKQIWQAKAEENGNTLKFVISDDLPKSLLLDPVRLRQCISNLIGNAIKFTKDGDIDVRVRASSLSSAPHLTISVSDTGIGIQADQMDKIFKPFTQADVSITRKFGGTGLGLHIVRSLVETMGGQIKVESTEGRGSNFQFSIKAHAIKTDDFDIRPSFDVAV